MKLPKIFRRKKALRLPKTGVSGLRETFFGASPVSVSLESAALRGQA